MLKIYKKGEVSEGCPRWESLRIADREGPASFLNYFNHCPPPHPNFTCEIKSLDTYITPVLDKSVQLF